MAYRHEKCLSVVGARKFYDRQNISDNSSKAILAIGKSKNFTNLLMVIKTPNIGREM